MSQTFNVYFLHIPYIILWFMSNTTTHKIFKQRYIYHSSILFERRTRAYNRWQIIAVYTALCVLPIPSASIHHRAGETMTTMPKFSLPRVKLFRLCFTLPLFFFIVTLARNSVIWHARYFRGATFVHAHGVVPWVYVISHVNPSLELNFSFIDEFFGSQFSRRSFKWIIILIFLRSFFDKNEKYLYKTRSRIQSKLIDIQCLSTIW